MLVYSLTFTHIGEATNVIGLPKNKFIESLESLAAVDLQDHYIDDAGNLTVIQFLSEGSVKNQRQRCHKRRKVGSSKRNKNRK